MIHHRLNHHQSGSSSSRHDSVLASEDRHRPGTTTFLTHLTPPSAHGPPQYSGGLTHSTAATRPPATARPCHARLTHHPLVSQVTYRPTVSNSASVSGMGNPRVNTAGTVLYVPFRTKWGKEAVSTQITCFLLFFSERSALCSDGFYKICSQFDSLGDL